MHPRLFSSLILRELIKELKQIATGDRPVDEDWGEHMATKYRRELEEQPVVYLEEKDNLDARQCLAWYREYDLNLADRATQGARGNHAAEIRNFLRSKHNGWPVLAEHEGMEDTHYPFPSEDRAPTCFKEWFAVAIVWRLTRAIREVSFQDATIGTAESVIHRLPMIWEGKLDECMQITEASAVVPAPKGGSLPLRRRDIDSVLPASDFEADESGLLTDRIINSWFQILFSHQQKQKPGCTVIVLPDSLDLAAATPEEVAEKVMLVNEDLEMMLFPTVIKERHHCILAVAYPRRKVLTIYDSLGFKSSRALQKDRPWIKENYRPDDGDWEVIWIECPHQGEEVACGVFMLINALFAVLVKDPAGAYCAEDTMFLRRYIAAIICMGKLPERV